MRALLHDVADHAADWLEQLPERPVRPDRTPAEMRVTADLNDAPLPVDDVIAGLAREALPGLTAINSPRFFGFVMGGAHPAGIAADWLATAWDQNVGLAAPTPAAAAFEDVAGRWLAELLGLPATASFALVTGCQMAHVTGLAAARHRVLARVGPRRRARRAGRARRRSASSPARSATSPSTARCACSASARARSSRSPTDGRGAMRADALGRRARRDRRRTRRSWSRRSATSTAAPPTRWRTCAPPPAPPAPGCTWTARSGSGRRRARRGAHLVRGVEQADSWATDAHKWLNVPFDCGIAFVRDREAHRAAMTATAAYLVQDAGGPREPLDWTPEFSRRARGLAVYATLRALGRDGVAELVDRLCACAERFAQRLAGVGFDVLGQELNQVLVACATDAATDATLAAVQAEGTCYPSGTTWRGRRCIRLSVCNWQTTFADVDRSVDAMARVVPQPDHAPLTLEAEDAERGGAQRQAGGGLRR